MFDIRTASYEDLIERAGYLAKTPWSGAAYRAEQQAEAINLRKYAEARKAGLGVQDALNTLLPN